MQKRDREINKERQRSRVAELIRRETSKALIHNDILTSFSRGAGSHYGDGFGAGPIPTAKGAEVTVMEVTMSLDLRIANVYCSLIADDKKGLLKALQAKAPRFRKQLAESLGLRHTPEIRFYLDDRLDKAAKIDSLIDTR